MIKFNNISLSPADAVPAVAATAATATVPAAVPVTTTPAPAATKSSHGKTRVISKHHSHTATQHNTTPHVKKMQVVVIQYNAMQSNSWCCTVPSEGWSRNGSLF